MTLHVGFTGGRLGATREQLAWMRDTLAGLFEPDAVFHHGDCIGKDSAAHEVALHIGYRIVVHPPDIDFFRAHCRGENVEIRPVRPYLMRNGDIVKESQVLVAVPDGSVRIRSGTWYTVRRARAAELPIHICPHYLTAQSHA